MGLQNRMCVAALLDHDYLGYVRATEGGEVPDVEQSLQYELHDL